jgi:hypothetical protein
MQAIQAFCFSGSYRQSWIAPEDCVLVRVSSLGTFGAVSYDPAVNANDFTGGFSRIEENCLGAVGSGNVTAESKSLEIQKIPISKGRKIFVASAGAGTIFLHFDNPS